MLRQIARYQLIVDIVVAGGFFFVLAPIALAFAGHGTSLSNLPVLAAMSAALAVRRLSPGLSLAVAWAGAIFQMAVGQTPLPSNVAIFAVLYATAAYGNRVVKWLGLTSAGVGAIVSTSYLLLAPVFSLNVVGGRYGALGTLIVTFGIVLVLAAGALGLSWTCGLAVRTSREVRERRAAQERAEVARRQARHAEALEAERGRIARDMHDVVAHSLAVVIAQADGARYAQRTDPSAVDTALDTISATAREALGDVRGLLEQLRYSAGDGPQPTLADLAPLYERIRAAGLNLHTTTTEEPMPLGAAAQLACYRIIQEALTNALRHGDVSKPATVEERWDGDGLTVRVSNAVRPSSEPMAGEGHGLPGMTERAALAGGSVRIDTTLERFTVTMHIPGAGPVPTVPGPVVHGAGS